MDLSRCFCYHCSKYKVKVDQIIFLPVDTVGLPSHPVVKNLCFHCRGMGKHDPTCHLAWPKNISAGEFSGGPVARTRSLIGETRFYKCPTGQPKKKKKKKIESTLPPLLNYF